MGQTSTASSPPNQAATLLQLPLLLPLPDSPSPHNYRTNGLSRRLTIVTSSPMTKPEHEPLPLLLASFIYIRLHSKKRLAGGGRLPAFYLSLLVFLLQQIHTRKWANKFIRFTGVCQLLTCLLLPDQLLSGAFSSESVPHTYNLFA